MAEVYRNDTLLGTAVVVDGTAQVTVPADTTVRVVFRPVSGDLAGSQATVTTGPLAVTGSADASGIVVWLGALALAAGAALWFSGRMLLRRRGARGCAQVNGEE